jgi:UDP-N-acetyl-alpha-D-muramoyl-L-alanyl-L-glutamate epimerase
VSSTALFDPAAVRTFRFTGRSLDGRGVVRLGYALDERYEFEERFELPVGPAGASRSVEPLLSLLHWVAGVSYYKTAVPSRLVCETGAPPPAAARLLEALYSEGLGEFAVVNRLPRVPRPAFPVATARDHAQAASRPLKRVLVPVGGGKDSAVAIEVVRRSGLDAALFSVGTAPAIDRTVAVAGLSRLLVTRRIDPRLATLNAAGALNGHVPITAIISCVAALTAALHGYDAVALANERSASSGNTFWDGIEVNHQFSKGAAAERLLRAAIAETGAPVDVFSILRPASELAIARAFSRLERYHPAFTSCNRVFRLDPALRARSWCCDCHKCRFVFLILAPFLAPDRLREIFGRPMLDDDSQFAGFALLTATGGHKPFECVGEERESVAAIRMLAGDARWRESSVVRRLVAEVLPHAPAAPDDLFELSDDHAVPLELIGHVRALLGA